MKKIYSIIVSLLVLMPPPSIHAQKRLERDINDGKIDNQSVSITSARATRMTEAYAELEEQYLKGVGLVQLGKLEGAINVFEEVLRQDDRNDAAAYQLARVYERTKQTQLAFANAQRAIAISPENRWYKVFLVGLYERNGEYKKAAQLGEQIALTDGKDKFDEELQGQLAENLARSGQLDKALKIYDEFEKKYGIQEEIARKKYAIFLEKKDLTRATETLKKYAEAEPNNLDALHLLAESYLSQGKMTEAEQVYDRILAQKPDDSRANLVRSKKRQSEIKTSTSSQDLAYLSEKANFFDDKNIGLDEKLREILPFLQKINNPANKQNAANLLQKMLEIANQLETQYPTEPKVFALKGDLLYQNNQPNEALIQYEKCIQKSKNVYSIYEQKMRIEDEIGDYAQLLVTSNDATDRFPNQASAFFMNGMANARLSKIDEAHDAFQQALVMSSRKPALRADILAELGWVRARMKQFESAEKCFAEANQIAPNAPTILIRQANAMLLGPEPMRRDALNLVAKLSEVPLGAQGWEAIGDFYARANQTAKALEWWQKAKQNGSKSKNLDKKIAQQKIVE